MSLRIIKYAFLIFGFFVLALAANEIDLEEVFKKVVTIGWLGFGTVLGLYFIAFLLDTMTWTLAIPSLPLNIKWVHRTFVIRLVGEAFNNTIPGGGVAGEPVKASLIKSYYGIGYQEGVTSLILAKTINMISLCLFLCFGFLMMITSGKLPLEAKQVSLAGLITVLLATLLLFLVQKIHLTSRMTKFLTQFKIAFSLNKWLSYLKEFDIRLSNFYQKHWERFGIALALALGNWMLGALEIYYVMKFLGAPVSLSEAYIIEAVAQMVRMGTFFIPMSIGTQEVAFLVIVDLITGSSTVGMALGIIRRLREIIWIAVGLILGLSFSVRKK